MRDFKVGDTVELTGASWADSHSIGDRFKVKEVDEAGWAEIDDGWLVDPDPEAIFAGVVVATPVDPDHYKFPGGIEVRQISAHLTSFGGQALQYIARSTRLDGKNKGDSVENLRKAIAFLNWEIERLGNP